jgi:hypothetical protein
MKKLILILVAIVAFHIRAQDITAGQTFQDGQHLAAAQLMALVNQAVINPAFYTAKVSQTNLAPTDILLVYSPASGTFHQVSGALAVFGNYAIVNGQVERTTVETNTYYLQYNATNQELEKINATNLAIGLAPFLPVASFDFSNSLSIYPLTTNSFRYDPVTPTNDPAFILVWGTNGAPYRSPLSAMVPFASQQFFLPWTFYGTNAGVTNLWGFSNPFEITNLFVYTNGVPNATPTISDSDDFPLFSTQQNTNTAAKAAAVAQYAQAYAPHTRIQFADASYDFTVSNKFADTALNYIMATNIPQGQTIITNLAAVSFSGALSNTVPVISAGALYYVRPNSTFRMFQIFTNLSDALTTNNPVVVTTNGSGTATMSYVKPLRAFNAEVVPTASGYQVYFRTNSATNNYYVFGSGFAVSSVPTISGFRVVASALTAATTIYIDVTP